MDDKHANALKKLKTARGQIDATIKMVEDDRYCVDISNQILAAIGLLKQANMDILDAHIKTCVAHAILEGEAEGTEKMDEIIALVRKYLK